MPTAHLIHGYLGAGKTTLAHCLEDHFRAVRFSHDDWMSRLFGADPSADSFAAGAERVSQLMHPIWTRCLAVGVDVVLDLAFWSRSQRDEVRQHVIYLGASPRLYRLEASDEVAWNRIAHRNTQLGANLLISRETFDALKFRFEPLDADEVRVEVAAGWKDDNPWTPRP